MGYQDWMKQLVMSVMVMTVAACSHYTVPPPTPDKIADTTDTGHTREYETIKGFQAWQLASDISVPVVKSSGKPPQYTPSHGYRRAQSVSVISERAYSRSPGDNHTTGTRYLNMGTGYHNLPRQSPRSTVRNDVINPQTGEIYYGIGNGYISPKGHFIQDFGNGVLGTPNGLVRPLPY